MSDRTEAKRFFLSPPMSLSFCCVIIHRSMFYKVPQTTGGQEMDSPRAIRTRRRPAFSCTECRRRKVRCDRVQPCSQCSAHNVPSCTYVESYGSRPPHHRTSPTSNRQLDQELEAQRAPERQSSSIRSSHNPAAGDRIHGTISKTRVYGQGHWMNAMSLVKGLPMLEPMTACFATIFQHTIVDPGDPISQTVAQCKQLARDIKRQRPSRRCLPPDIHLSFPDRQVVDELVQLYFATFERCYRILYQPSFQSDYERYIDNLETAKSSFIVELLLIMSTAGPLHSDANVRSCVAARAQDWIQISQTWLSAPMEKDRLTVKGIQVHCILLLARQVNGVGADLVWISAGSLLRMAMQMGLHQDPEHLGEMGLEQKEIRRRLWYTILEINVQAALDSGMSPMITEQEYNTLPPVDLSDTVLEGNSQEHPAHIPFQRLLATSLPIRLRVSRAINSLQEELPYDEVLQLENDLSLACRTATQQLHSHPNHTHTHQFAYSHCSHLLRRFTLCLHFPSAIKSHKNPLYSYSQKACLEAALDLVSLIDDPLYNRLLLSGGGIFRDIITRGAFVIYLELSSDLDANSSIFARDRNRARQEPLLRYARRTVQYARERMMYGETNVKGYVFICMGVAQVEAMLEGREGREAAMHAARESLDECFDILKKRAGEVGDVVGNGVGASNTVSPGSFLDANFDFLGEGGFDFGLEGSILTRQLEGWD